MLLKKIKTILNLIEQKKYDFLFHLIKKKFFKDTEQFIPSSKKNLLNKYFNFFENGIVRTNYYKNSIFKFSANSEITSFPSKILGYYELEIQKELLKLQKKYKVKNFVQFGVADGYHLIGLSNKLIFQKYFAFDISSNAIRNFKQNLKQNKKIKNLKIFLKRGSFKTVNKYISNNEKVIYLIDIEGDEINILNEENIKYVKKAILLIEIHFFTKKERKKILDFLSKYFEVKIINSQNKKILYKKLNKKITDKFNRKELKILMDDGRPDNMKYFSCVPKNYI